jgi:hypothetical protein
MKSLLIVGMMFVSAPAFAQDKAFEEMISLSKDYQTCLVDKTTLLGTGNTEPTDNVFMAAQAECAGARGAIVAKAYGTYSRQLAAEYVQGLTQAAEEGGKSRAVLALLKARAAK